MNSKFTETEKQNQNLVENESQLHDLSLSQPQGEFNEISKLVNLDLSNSGQKQEENQDQIREKNKEETKTKNEKTSLKSIILKKLRFDQKISRIKELSCSYRFKQLKKEHYQLIGDKAHFQERGSVGSDKIIGQVIQNSKAITLGKKFIIDPDRGLYSILGMVVGLFGYLNFLLFPIEFSFPDAFEDSQASNNRQIFQILSLLVFLGKILLGFVTAFKMKNILVENIREIATNYTQSSLLMDMLPIFEISINYGSNFPFLGIVYTMKIFNFTNLVENFCVYLHLEEKFLALYQVTRLVLIIMSVAHYNCLIFYTISQTGDEQTTWIEAQGLFGEPWYFVYERSLYFMIITMITVGFGDITPVTSRERIVLIFITLFSCFLFGYAVNTVGSIFQQRDYQASQLQQLINLQKANLIFYFPYFFQRYFQRKKKFQISNYLQNRGVTEDIQRQVLRQVEYISTMERDGLFDDSIDQILNQVSQDLQEQVMTNISMKILRNCQLLNNSLSLKCLQEYSQFMRQKTLTPGEKLFKKGENENRIYFINKGEMEMYLENSNKEFEIILRRINVSIPSSVLNLMKPVFVVLEQLTQYSLISKILNKF